MSSELFREGLRSSARRAPDPGTQVSHVGWPTANSAARQRLPPPHWQPQNWSLATRVLALTLVPLLLALVLGALRISVLADHSLSVALRDSMIIVAVTLVALIVLVMLARSILNPFRLLRTAGTDVADRRLPAVTDMLATTEGRTGDIRFDPPPPPDSGDGAERAARAFDALQREVVRLAAEQDALRATVNDMLVNLSWHSQGLVERQLALIDELEQTEQDPDRLAALFRLDHLATRMRRNGENLLVLAGAELRQRGGEPMRMVDVLRAAVSEIENYQRVAIAQLPRCMVSGLVVNDIVHLLAELLDNATSYSSPHTQVTLGARFGDDAGLAIDVSDAGTGIARDRLVGINRRLAGPQTVDVSVSRQMGLFVVGQLANRCGLRVYLTANAGPGITATVILPSQLIIPELPETVQRHDTGSLPRAYVPPAQPWSLGDMHAHAPVAPPEQLPAFGSSEPLAGPGLLPTLGFSTPAPAPMPMSVPVPAPMPIPVPEPTYAESVLDQPELLADTAGAGAHDLDTPIFRAMLSKWFTEPPDPGTSADTSATAQDGWESEADAGWLAAEAASEPTADEMTAAGLPKRSPQAFLVPGSVGSSTATGDTAPAAVTPAAAARNAEAVRGRMSSYQQGLSRGRHAGPASTPDELPTGDALGRHTRSADAGGYLGTDSYDEPSAEGTW
jgi:signal transduction histidine kinase